MLGLKSTASYVFIFPDAVVVELLDSIKKVGLRCGMNIEKGAKYAKGKREGKSIFTCILLLYSIT